MTEPASLEMLCFTDCGDGEGVGGGSGFGVRAMSTGVTPALSRLVQEACLYEPPTAWINEGRPLADYPRSLAHVARGGLYATASGRYLGTELLGAGREGNHFTHAIGADHPEGYGYLRPAQLWGSPLWRDAAGKGTAWSALPGPPEPGPLDAQAVQRWVRAQPMGEETLLAVCSALEQGRAGGLRLVFIADAPQPVLAWVVAATLLLPRADALRVGFKVFATEATSGPYDIVALHPDWAAGYRIGAERGFTIFDLVAGEHTTVSVTESAAFWVPLFLRRDCLDVLDAVELAGLCRPTAEVVPGRPERVAAVALVLGEPLRPGELDGVVRWVDETSGAALPERRRRELLDLLLDAGPDADQLRVLAGLADRLHEDAVREKIRWRVFGMETAALTPALAQDAYPSDAATASHALAVRIEAAPPEAVPRLLSLADDYALRPDPAGFPNGLRRFARWWADGALDVPGVDRWACRHLVEDLLRDELSARLLGAPESSRRTLGDRWWRRLWPTVRDPRADLDAQLAAAALEHGSEEEQREITQRVLDALSWPTPPDALDVAWQALYARRWPTADELVAVLDRFGSAVQPSSWVLTTMGEAMAATRRPTPALLDVLRRLADWGHQIRHGVTAVRQRNAVRVREMCRQLADWDQDIKQLDPEVAAKVGDDIGTLNTEILAAAAADLLSALAALRPAVGAHVLAEIPIEKRNLLVRHLKDTITAGSDSRILALTVALAVELHDRDPGNARDLSARLSVVGRSLDQAGRGLVSAAFEDTNLEHAWLQLTGTRWERFRHRRRGRAHA